jgi:hypothetical protein
MSKPRSRQRGQVRLARVRVVQLAPARESRTPFCAYYGPAGETCSQTTGLKVVWRLPGPPTYMYMACPLHYVAVQQMVLAFLARLVNGSQEIGSL